MDVMDIKFLPINDIIPYLNNPRNNDGAAVDKVAVSLQEYGWQQPIVVDKDMVVIAGHTRLKAAKKLKQKKVPVLIAGDLTDEKIKAYRLDDNRSGQESTWDLQLLKLELEALKDLDFDLALTAFDPAELADILGETGGDGTGEGSQDHIKLSDKFLVPPFSVLDTRQAYWQDRKRGWLSMGIKSEVGRGDNLLYESEELTSKNLNFYREKEKAKAAHEAKNKFGKCLETGIGAAYGREEMTGTSIFDPVLCELAYLWFTPKGGVILDPFAGGSVRGVVAAKLDRQYFGVELREEQVKANRAQWDDIGKSQTDNTPVWHTGDSRHITQHAKGVAADFVFSCPPYADLEVYSDDPDDLSTLEYAEFVKAYGEIINASCSLLKENRFACFVVGEVRDKKGLYYNFVGDTINAFLNAGLRLYNEAILVNCLGSLPIRAGRAFSASRKMGKTHQNVLVFVKGCPKLATQACGEVFIDPALFDTIVPSDEGLNANLP